MQAESPGDVEARWLQFLPLVVVIQQVPHDRAEVLIAPLHLHSGGLCALQQLLSCFREKDGKVVPCKAGLAAPWGQTQTWLVAMGCRWQQGVCTKASVSFHAADLNKPMWGAAASPVRWCLCCRRGTLPALLPAPALRSPPSPAARPAAGRGERKGSEMGWTQPRTPGATEAQRPHPARGHSWDPSQDHPTELGGNGSSPPGPHQPHRVGNSLLSFYPSCRGSQLLLSVFQEGECSLLSAPGSPPCCLLPKCPGRTRPCSAGGGSVLEPQPLFPLGMLGGSTVASSSAPRRVRPLTTPTSDGGSP